jgi:hypothetical protein
MYRGYKIVSFIPAGRERTMSILVNHLLRFKDNPIDEVLVCVNTQDEQDLAYINSLNDGYFKATHRLEGGWDEPKQLNTGKFYKHMTDENTIYIRFDDDIVYIDDLFFKNMLDFRIDNPSYLCVMANIWNNAITSYIAQQNGVIDTKHGEVKEKFCMDVVGWKSGKFAVYIHNILLEKIKKNKTSDLFFEKSDLADVRRFSISCFSFFGREFKRLFNGEVVLPDSFANSGPYNPLDEEMFLTEFAPMEYGLRNTICGSALVSHYTFAFQRKEVNATNILEQYKKISQEKLSSAYYQLLE